MENVDFKKRVFTVCRDSENKYYIEENVLGDRIRLAAEECTSPRGVEPRLHINGCKLMWWEVNGREMHIETYDTEEEAEQEWYNRTYEHDYMNSDYCYVDYDTELDAKVAIAENLTNEDGITRDVEYVEKMLEERSRDYRFEKTGIHDTLVGNLMNEWKKSVKLGHSTKALRKVYDSIRRGCYYYHDAEKMDIDMMAYQRCKLYEVMRNVIGNNTTQEAFDHFVNAKIWRDLLNSYYS